MGKSRIYRIVFYSQGKIYELHARSVSQGQLFAFVEVEDIIFEERSELLVDPSEEKLKAEFAGVKRTYIPLQAVIRIDEVQQEGPNRIHATDGDSGKVTPFPLSMVPPGPQKD
jgi:hypothetical protein